MAALAQLAHSWAPISPDRGGCHLLGLGQCVPDPEITAGPQLSVVIHLSLCVYVCMCVREREREREREVRERNINRLPLVCTLPRV